MRSIDDIIDRQDTSSMDHGSPDESHSATVQSLPAADHEDESRRRAINDGRRRRVCGGDGELLTTMKSEAPLEHSDRPSTDHVHGGLHVDRLRSTRESAASMDAEPLWVMFDSPLSQLCRRLLADSTRPNTQDRRKPVTETVSRDPVSTSSKSTTHFSKNSRQSVEVQTLPASVDVQSSIASRDGTRSNGRAPLAEGHKPPLPAKPSLPPKPPISKKPSFSKDTPGGVTRVKPSSLSSASTSSSSTQQRLSRTTSSGSGCVDSLAATSVSAPTSPIVEVNQRDASHQAAAVRRTASSTASTNVPDRRNPAASAGGDRKSSTVGGDRLKATKSEEFLARIHRRSVSPLGTPRLVSRSSRGKSVDLSAASDMSTTIGRRTLSKEWAVVTTTTQEEVMIVYRPPATNSTPETVHVSRPTSADETTRLYKTTIDNIRLSVAGCSGDSGGGGVQGSRQSTRQSARTSKIPNDGRESTNGARQLDDLISSLIEIAVDVEDTGRPLQASSLRHAVVSDATHY